MKPRLIILIVAAAGLAVFFAVRASAPKAEVPEMRGDLTEKELEEIREQQVMIQDQVFDCEETEDVYLSIRVGVDPADKKNRLHFYITEENGFFAETFNVTFYYKPTPDTTPAESPYVFTQFLNQYVAANDTFKGCIEVVPPELARVGGDMGTSENWGAEIIDFHSACVDDPDPLPKVPEMRCEG